MTTAEINKLGDDLVKMQGRLYYRAQQLAGTSGNGQLIVELRSVADVLNAPIRTLMAMRAER